jgi:hypothetical protein
MVNNTVGVTAGLALFFGPTVVLGVVGGEVTGVVLLARAASSVL